MKKYDKLSEEEKLALVAKNGFNIVFFKKPSEALKLAAVKQNGKVFKYIKKPSIELELEAAKQIVLDFNPIFDWKISQKVKNEVVKYRTQLYWDNQFQNYKTVINTKDSWDNVFYHTLIGGEFKLTKKQFSKVLKEYNLLQLFK